MDWRGAFKLLTGLTVLAAVTAVGAPAFEGRIQAVTAQGRETNTLLYTVGTNFLRVEMTATNRPNPVDILDIKSGELTLFFPHNRSFVCLKPVTENSSTPSPAMPMMPMPMEKMELQATGQKTNLLGYACERFQIKQRGETMEVWATDQLFPYQPYIQNQRPHIVPRMIEEQWPGLLTAGKLFPLRASLHYDNGVERFRFEVRTITPEKIEDPGGRLFRPPPEYRETEPLPF